MPRWIPVLALLPLSACDFASSVVCLAVKPREECVRAGMRDAALEVEGSKALSAGELVLGEARVYSLRVPSEAWIQLPAGRNDTYPDRDLRLVHEIGATVDGFTPPQDGRTLDEIAIAKLPESAAECVEMEVPDGSPVSRLVECCAVPESGRITLCHYALAADGCGVPIVVTGIGSPQHESGTELEQILTSVRCVD